jgi:hypothetical protein
MRVNPWIDVLGLLPAAAIVLWLAPSSTPIDMNAFLAIAALALCGVPQLRRWSILVAVPAALAVGATTHYRESWVPWLVALFVWRGALSAAWLEERLRGTRVVPLLFWLTAGGAYGCLPDTERIIPVAVVTTAVAVAALISPMVSFGGPGSMAMIGLLGWIAAAGGIGRPAAIVGALGAFGVLVLAGGLRLPRDIVLLGIQFACVAACSRYAGISHDLHFATVVVGATLCVTLMAVVVSARWWPARDGSVTMRGNGCG